MSLADVDPLGSHQIGQPQRVDTHGSMNVAGGRHHLVKTRRDTSQ